MSAVAAYHEQLVDLCTVATERQILKTDDRAASLRRAAAGADLAVVGTSAHHLLYDAVFGSLPDELATELDCSVLLVHSREPRRHTFLRYLLERVAF